ncbi:DUF6247 family protein [Actinophytocola sp. NPDC049390]|uniref:DUF6247 family protein n=1 Tax=Actinophytocola sp. NPDC049390 TaxID=3363894 RepID=UPI0037972D15
MSAEPVEPPRPRTFTDATPREIRSALIPEEQRDFDTSWRAALTEAAETMDLGEVFRTLDNWRTHAILTDQLGHRGYREWLASLERRTHTGEQPAGSMPWTELKAELGL